MQDRWCRDLAGEARDPIADLEHAQPSPRELVPAQEVDGRNLHGEARGSRGDMECLEGEPAVGLEKMLARNLLSGAIRSSS